MQQQRHPGFAAEFDTKTIDANAAPEIAIDEDDTTAIDKRAMDQSRGLNAAARSYGINQAAERDLVPGLGA